MSVYEFIIAIFAVIGVVFFLDMQSGANIIQSIRSLLANRQKLKLRKQEREHEMKVLQVKKEILEGAMVDKELREFGTKFLEAGDSGVLQLAEKIDTESDEKKDAPPEAEEEAG